MHQSITDASFTNADVITTSIMNDIQNIIFKDLSDPPQPRSTLQQCALGILRQNDDGNRQLVSNPNCAQSKNLLQSPPPPFSSNEKILTYLLLYYNDYEFLAHQLESWNKLSNDTLSQIQFMIIDDGSTPGQRAVELININHQHYDKSFLLDISIYEIDQDLSWNIGGARNLGFWMASTKWIFMNDADILVYPQTMDYILNLTSSKITKEAEEAEIAKIQERLQESPTNDTKAIQLPVTFGYFQRKGKHTDLNQTEPHPAVMLTKRQTYWNAEGCDEDFVGSYGMTDPHFRYRGSTNKAFHFIQTFTEQDSLSIPPLHQMNSEHMDLTACPVNMKCLSPVIGEGQVPLIKNPERNRGIFYQKKIGNISWSDEYLRFTWRKVWDSSS